MPHAPCSNEEFFAMKRVALLSILLAVTGCSATSEDTTGMPAPETVAEGLTILDSGSDTRFEAVYKKDDVAIYLQAVRGQPTPDIYQEDPASPKYEVDARFVSDDGRVFYTQRGGDHWIDPTWAEDLEHQTELPATRESNAALFEMAAEAAEALALEFPSVLPAEEAAVLPELHALKQIGL
ncbi:MAG: hypothetical protein ACOC1F_14520, partial [Myxococcota bacterium]